MKTKRLWCFFDINNPIVAWEVAIGRISSIPEGYFDYLKPKELIYSCLSLWQLSRLRKSVENKNWSLFKMEMDMEKHRHENHPNQVSRLKGCYFFESKEDAIKIRKNLGWFWMKDENLSAVTFFYKNENSLSSYDALWIQDEMNIRDISSYFKGETRFNNPAKEILAYGRGIVENSSLIQRAEESFLKRHPSSYLILKSAQLIFNDRFLAHFNHTKNLEWSAYHAAQMIPFYHQSEKPNTAKITYIMSEIAFRKYGFLHGNESDKINMPDLRPHEFYILNENKNNAS